MNQKRIPTAAEPQMQGHVHGPDCNHDHDDDQGHGHGPAEPFRRDGPKLGRNDPCPCGSGKKFKKCHGVAA